MSFDPATNNLNLTPGVNDFGLFTLKVTYVTDFDGINPS